MLFSELLLVFGAPYLLAWLTNTVVQRMRILPITATPATIARNTLGRLTSRQRQALLMYNLPEIVFGVVAIGLALGWQPDSGTSGVVLRWGLAGMALVRLGLLWPVGRDLLAGRVASLHGPLRKIQFLSRRALATEDGPQVVLPVESALYAAYESGVPVTIFYAPYTRRVVAVQPLAEEAAPVDTRLAPV